MTTLTTTYTLANGVQIPVLGFGTWQTPDGDTAIKSVKAALEAGYRHIDTAQAYQNEASVGTAIQESGVARQDLFLTTKIWNANHSYDLTMQSFEESLQKLQTDYVDLLLIHWPTQLISVITGKQPTLKLGEQWKNSTMLAKPRQLVSATSVHTT